MSNDLLCNQFDHSHFFKDKHVSSYEVVLSKESRLFSICPKNGEKFILGKIYLPNGHSQFDKSFGQLGFPLSKSEVQVESIFL